MLWTFKNTLEFPFLTSTHISLAYILSPLEVYVSLLPFPVKLLHVIIAIYPLFFTSYPLYNPLPSGIGSDLSQKHFAKIMMIPRLNPWDPFCLSSFLTSRHTWPVLPSQKGWFLSFNCIIISSFSPYSSNPSFYLFGPILLDFWVILGSKNVALFPPSVSFGSLLIVWVMFRCHIPVTLSWRG